MAFTTIRKALAEYRESEVQRNAILNDTEIQLLYKIVDRKLNDLTINERTKLASINYRFEEEKQATKIIKEKYPNGRWNRHREIKENLILEALSIVNFEENNINKIITNDKLFNKILMIVEKSINENRDSKIQKLKNGN